MTVNDTTFSDADGRDWRVRILWGHPSPTELGIHAARFDPVDDPDGETRVGYVEIGWLEENDEEMLQEALEEAEPEAPESQ